MIAAAARAVSAGAGGRLTWGPVKASPEAQQRLLELADLDAELGRLDHRRRTLPEIEEADRIEGRDRELHDQIVSTEAEEKDLSREQVKAEGDVDQVRARVDRDRKRLEGGQVSSARELETLQSEIVSLARRQSDLEEIVLDVMERRETAQSRRDSLAAERSRAPPASSGTSSPGGTPPWRTSRTRQARPAVSARRSRPRSPPTCWRCTRSCGSSTVWARPPCAAAAARAVISR